MVTKQELEAAKIDVKNAGEAVNEKKIVNPRYGAPFKSLPLAIEELNIKADDVIAKGFYTGYATETALKASLPAVSEMRARADDTRKIWRWSRTSAEGVTPVIGTWTDTGLSDLDQSKNYVNEKTETITSQILENNEDPFSIEDSNNKIAFAVKADGTTEVAKLDVKEFAAEVVNSNLDTGSAEVSDAFSDELEVIDSNNKIAFAVRQDGTVEASKIDVKELLVGGNQLDANPNSKKIGVFRYNIAHTECLGQSLSLGTNGSPILTTMQKFDNLMFAGGIRKQHPNNTGVDFFSSLVPLIEALSADNGNPYIYGETPVGGLTEQIKDLIKSENKVEYTQQNYQLLGTASGEGGKRIHELRDTYVPTNLLPAITAAYNLAQDQGKTYGMSAITFVHGEADNANPTTITQYKTITLEVLATIDAHVKATNGQTENVKLITSQLASFGSAIGAPKIELALYQLAMENPNKVFMACPLYIFDYTDPYHLNNVGSKWLGAYLGLTYKRVVIDGEDWKPVHPISYVKQGRILEVKFHVPVQPLVFDTTQVTKNTDAYGFTLVDSAGATIAIESVAITQPDTVKFVTATPIPAGAKLRYAWTPVAQPNRNTGPRGNLRDSQGDSIVFDESGINKRMDNWCPIFEYTI